MNPLKKPQKATFIAKKSTTDFLNPSLSANNELILSKLNNTTANLLPKSTRGIINLNKMLNYKKAKVYDAGGDVKKQWYVYYSFKNIEGSFQRFKVFEDINTASTKAERYDLANYYKNVINLWLEEGNSPFVRSETNNDKNILTCIDKFTAFLDNSKLRPSTIRKYKTELRVFKAWIEKAGLSTLFIGQIKKQHIFEFVDEIRRRDIQSGKTVNHYLNDIRRFFNHFIDNYDDYLTRNPAAKITRDPVLERGNIAYTEKEFADIRKYCLDNDKYIWFVCQCIYYTGLRNEAELLEMRIGDFDLANNLFFVDAWISKNKTRQSAPIYPEFADLLKSINIAQYPADYYLFGRGDKPGTLRVGTDTFAKRFAKVKKHFGLGNEYGLYCFKSTRACHLFDDKATIREIQALFRHSDPMVTMKYLKSLGRVERSYELNKGRRI